MAESLDDKNVPSAASLFGDDSASSDIFGAAPSSEPDPFAPPAPPKENIDDVFSPSEHDTNHTNDVDDLFGGSSHEPVSDAFASTNTSGVDGYFDQPGSVYAAVDQPSSAAVPPTTNGGYGYAGHATNGYATTHDYSQANSYAPYEQPRHDSYAPTNQAVYESSIPSHDQAIPRTESTQPYNPYAPQTNSSVQNPYAPSYPASTPAYSNTTAPPNVHSLIPEAGPSFINSGEPNSYGAPQTQATHPSGWQPQSAYTSSPYGTANGGYGQLNSYGRAPEKPAAPAAPVKVQSFRSGSFNAYDPPIAPVRKSILRNASAHPPQPSPFSPYGSGVPTPSSYDQHYPAHPNAPAPPASNARSPPPPPPPARSTLHHPPPPRTPSVPPPHPPPARIPSVPPPPPRTGRTPAPPPGPPPPPRGKTPSLPPPPPPAHPPSRPASVNQPRGPPNAYSQSSYGASPPPPPVPPMPVGLQSHVSPPAPPRPSSRAAAPPPPPRTPSVPQYSNHTSWEYDPESSGFGLEAGADMEGSLLRDEEGLTDFGRADVGHDHSVHHDNHVRAEEVEEREPSPAAPLVDYVVPYPTIQPPTETVTPVDASPYRPYSELENHHDPEGLGQISEGFATNDDEDPEAFTSHQSYKPEPHRSSSYEPQRSSSHDSYAPVIPAHQPPPPVRRTATPPRRQIADSPSPYIPSIYSSFPPRQPAAPPAQHQAPPPATTNTYTPPPYNPYQPGVTIPAPAPPAPSYGPNPTLIPPPLTSAYSSSQSIPTVSPSDISPLQQRSAYAPSPSQSAADDPRTFARIPIFHFGFGGKVATSFPSRPDDSAGFDVALSGRRSGTITLRSLKRLGSESALDPTVAEFPGPLFTGPNSAPTLSGLTRGSGSVPAQSSSVKTKKASVVKYLDERAEELHRGLGYLSANADPSERRATEGRVLLLRLLKVMVENDGKVSGSADVVDQVRSAILPDGPSFTASSSLNSTLTPALGYGLGDTMSELKEAPLTTYSVRPSALNKIQTLLLNGKRREACHYALDQKMWAHAMVISHTLDQELWKDVVNEFIRSELGAQVAQSSGSASNGRESLRVAYSLFTGQSTAAIQELLPPKNLAKVGESLSLLPPTIQATPISPNFPKPVLTAHIPQEVLGKWSETAATILSISNGSGEQCASMTALGDYLISNGWVEAAHVCYILSLQTSPIGGAGQPSVRLSLVGSDVSVQRRNVQLDADSIKFTEILEFALSLLPAAGKEPFAGLPHLQSYKLLRAWQLAEVGQVKEASKYCDAIGAILKANPRGSPFFTMTFLELHQELVNRLAGNSKNTSWISRTIKKPSMETISSWSLNKFTKFIEGDEPSPIPEEPTPMDKPAVGPFSHYSEISSATTSQLPSPNGSVKGASLAEGPPGRTGSAMSGRTMPPPPPAARSASAMGYGSSPAYGYAPPANGNGHADGLAVFTPPPAASGYSSGWWGASGSESTAGGDSDAANTPTATAFTSTASDAQDEGNFVSYMDSSSTATTPAPQNNSYGASYGDDEDDDDLGLGNASAKRRKSPPHAAEPSATAGTMPADKAKAEAKQADDENKKDEDKAPATPAKGWFGGWWGGKGDNKPKPVRANLGESKSSFYYDKDLKKWVNGKEGTSAASTPAPPPPPSRAQTASPSKMGGPHRPMSSAPPPPSSATPPPRAQSSMGLANGAPPPRSTPNSLRGPSGLSSSFVAETGGDGMLSAPPPPRAKSAQGQRKNARSRYVDIFATPSPPP